MQRTNVYLDDAQLELLRLIGERRGEPVAVLVREAIDTWLDAQGVRRIGPDEWERRLDALMDRRRAIAEREGFDERAVEDDVLAAVREVRRSRTARRR